MKIQFLGGARSVTGSQHLLSVNGSKILLECGLFQAAGTTRTRRTSTSNTIPRVSMLFSSLTPPRSCREYPTSARAGTHKGYSPPPLPRAVSDLLRDSAYLNEKDVEWVNKVRASKHEPPVKPLYTIDDAEDSLSHFVGIQYDKPFPWPPE